jgi:hypothetical protein
MNSRTLKRSDDRGLDGIVWGLVLKRSLARPDHLHDPELRFWIGLDVSLRGPEVGMETIMSVYVNSRGLIGAGPVGLVHTQDFQFSIRKAHLAALADGRTPLESAHRYCSA